MQQLQLVDRDVCVTSQAVGSRIKFTFEIDNYRMNTFGNYIVEYVHSVTTLTNICNQ